MLVERKRKTLTNYNNFDMLAEAFINNLDVVQTTKNSYINGLNRFNDYLNQKHIIEVTEQTLLDYKYYLMDYYKPNTINAYLTSLKAFYKFLEMKGISRDLTKYVKNVKTPQSHSKEALTIEQTKILLNSFNKDTLKGARDFAMINLMIHTGLRVAEVQKADIKDITQKGGKAVLYIQGKGRDYKDNYVVLTEATLKPIRAYLEIRGNDTEKALFTSVSNSSKARLTNRSISRVVKEAFKSIGLKSDKLTAHSTRHTAVTLSLLGGATIQEAQAMARHSNINTTMIYAHNINRINNSAEAKISALLGV